MMLREAVSFLIGFVIGSGGFFGIILTGIAISKRRFARKVGVKPNEVNSEWITSDYRT